MEEGERVSDSNSARRADLQVTFAGTDISEAVNKDLISFTYTDNEEDETDDLQIKMHDRDGKWLTKWLNNAINAAAEGGKTLDTKPLDSSSKDKKGSESLKYKVVSAGGVNIRSSPGEQYNIRGTLPYGTVIDVTNIVNGWAYFDNAGKHAYVKLSCLQKIGSSSTVTKIASTSTYSSVSTASKSGWNIGDEVIVSGTPQYSSYGVGDPGAEVTDYKGKITHLNLNAGIPYPIHVDFLGWFAENQVRRADGETFSSVEKEGSKGLKIAAAIVRRNWNSDGKDEVLECGQFELDGVDVSGPPSTITIKGTSLPYSSSIRQTLKSKSWENISLSGIVKQISGKNGMACMFESASDPKYTRVEQYRTSDISFLQTLCHNAGCSLKVTNNILVVFDQAEYEAKAALLTIKRGKEGGYTKYKLSTGENDSYTSCRVSCTNSSGVTISATAYVEDYKDDDKNKQCLEVRRSVSSQSEAQALAHKLLRLHNKYEFEVSFTFPGDPKLVAGNAVMLEEWGAWNGKYIISQAKHSISGSGYTTQITLRKALPTDNQSEVRSTGESDIDELARQVIRGDWGNGEERRKKLAEAGHDFDTVQARVNQLLGIK